MNRWRQVGGWLVNYWYIVCFTLAIAAFAAACLPSTNGRPSGEAGLQAATIAMSIAATLLVESVFVRGGTTRRLPRLFMGIMAMGSAYLWIAAEVEEHPLDVWLVASIGLVWASAAFTVLSVSVFFLFWKWSPNRRPETAKAETENHSVD